MRDIDEIIIDGIIEKERILQLKTNKNVTIKEYPNGFKKYYCPNCKDELAMKTYICGCGQHLEWGEEKPIY